MHLESLRFYLIFVCLTQNFVSEKDAIGEESTEAIGWQAVCGRPTKLHARVAYTVEVGAGGTPKRDVLCELIASRFEACQNSL